MVAERIDIDVAHEMWLAGDALIDVRSPEEYAGGHISGAVNVPIGVLPGGLDDLGHGPIMTTCSMGGRGGRAADLLAQAGRTAFSIDGGTKAWEAAGFPIVSGDQPGPRRR